ncbi:CRISPR-associated endonuclease Cas2 [Fontivita pretiosa]|uniref:CRISPR-associated endonuclease Cas2 n=1 Tax=Fontivita pretiosa TaxID=2989684 RepID=UPI003D164FA4
MLVLVTYDVSTTTPQGRRRLARVARTCQDFGQRVQNSVFECQVDPEQFARLKLRLLDIFDARQDSLRFYFLGSGQRKKVEHHGCKPSVDFSGPLIA